MHVVQLFQAFLLAIPPKVIKEILHDEASVPKTETQSYALRQPEPAPQGKSMLD